MGGGTSSRRGIDADADADADVRVGSARNGSHGVDPIQDKRESIVRQVIQDKRIFKDVLVEMARAMPARLTSVLTSDETIMHQLSKHGYTMSHTEAYFANEESSVETPLSPTNSPTKKRHGRKTASNHDELDSISRFIKMNCNQRMMATITLHQRLKKADSFVPLEELRKLYNDRDDTWSASLYFEVGRRFSKLGEPLLTVEALEEGFKQFEQQNELDGQDFEEGRGLLATRRLLARAHQQKGATYMAIREIQQVIETEAQLKPVPGKDFCAESYNILGRCYKDLGLRINADAKEEALKYLLKSFECYNYIFVIGGRKSYYFGINTAITAFMLDGQKVPVRAEGVRKPPLGPLSHLEAIEGANDEHAWPSGREYAKVVAAVVQKLCVHQIKERTESTRRRLNASRALDKCSSGGILQGQKHARQRSQSFKQMRPMPVWVKETKKHRYTPPLTLRTIAELSSLARETWDGEKYWLYTTLGEAHIILGEFDKAVETYQKASQLLRSAPGSFTSQTRTTRVQLAMMETAIAKMDDYKRFQLENPTFSSVSPISLADRLFPIPAVVVLFTNVDAIALPPRIEQPILDAILSEIRREPRWRTHGYGHVFSCIGGAVELLFLEEMLRQNKELRIALPIPKMAFFSLYAKRLLWLCQHRPGWLLDDAYSNGMGSPGRQGAEIETPLLQHMPKGLSTMFNLNVSLEGTAHRWLQRVCTVVAMAKEVIITNDMAVGLTPLNIRQCHGVLNGVGIRKAESMHCPIIRFFVSGSSIFPENTKTVNAGKEVENERNSQKQEKQEVVFSKLTPDLTSSVPAKTSSPVCTPRHDETSRSHISRHRRALSACSLSLVDDMHPDEAKGGSQRTLNEWTKRQWETQGMDYVLVEVTWTQNRENVKSDEYGRTELDETQQCSFPSLLGPISVDPADLSSSRNPKLRMDSDEYFSFTKLGVFPREKRGSKFRLPPPTDKAPSLVDEDQVLMALLFADIVGYSKLTEQNIFCYSKVISQVNVLLEKLPPWERPAARNTWGDAFYFAFDDVRSCGTFALQLCELITKTDWTQHGLPGGLSVRVGLHVGPAFSVYDQVSGKLTFNGCHVTRAARIEPITPPGHVYCSLNFAAISTTLGASEYECSDVGYVPLAKKYGENRVYHVHWKTNRH